jgi:hypothetical protein
MIFIGKKQDLSVMNADLEKKYPHHVDQMKVYDNRKGWEEEINTFPALMVIRHFFIYMIFIGKKQDLSVMNAVDPVFFEWTDSRNCQAVRFLLSVHSKKTGSTAFITLKSCFFPMKIISLSVVINLHLIDMMGIFLF